MAKTMVDKIRETEEKGNGIICEAELTAKNLVKEAGVKSRELTAAAVKQADADSAKIVSEAVAEAENIKASAQRRGWAEGEKLSAKADKNRIPAVEAAIEIIFS